jgi:hypothetical protein
MAIKNLRIKTRSSQPKSNKKKLVKRRKTLKKGGYINVPTGYSEFMENLYNVIDKAYAINIRYKLLQERNRAFCAGIVASISAKNKIDQPGGFGTRNRENNIRDQGDAIVTEIKKILKRADEKLHIYKNEKNDYPLSTLGAVQVVQYTLIDGRPKFKTDSPNFVNSIIRVIAEKNKVDMPLGGTTDHYKYQEYLLRNLLLAITEWNLSDLGQIGVKDAIRSVFNLVGRIVGRAGEKFIQGIEGIDKLKSQFERKIILTNSDNMWQGGPHMSDDHIFLTQDP